MFLEFGSIPAKSDQGQSVAVRAVLLLLIPDNSFLWRKFILCKNPGNSVHVS